MATSSGPSGWTTYADVVRTLRRRWDRGEFLSMFATGTAWTPLAVPLKGPTARDVAGDFTAAQKWVSSWQRRAQLRLECAPIGGRLIGANQVPRRAWVDSQLQLWTLLGVTSDARRFSDLLATATADTPRLVAWMAGHPMKVLALQQEWPAIVQTVMWVDAHWRPGMYLRQVDLPGVDTKFIERHRGVLADLLDCQLDGGRIDSTKPRSDFVGRYGFRDKPQYVRLRALDPAVRSCEEFSELVVRAGELAATPPVASTVYIVENEVTYLAFPPVEDAVVVFGGGYALARLASQTWLHDRSIVYWGDIDTHGFSILNQLRATFPDVRSMLMDRSTLLVHHTQWVREESPVNAHLGRLTDEERELYRDLVEDALGPSIRMEQERVRFSAILSAISARCEPDAERHQIGRAEARPAV